MASVTGRIKEIKQPRGGYINPKELEEIDLEDDYSLSENENLSPNIVGLAVDYLSRLQLNTSKEEAFRISILGSYIINDLWKAQKLLKKINGIDDKSIVAACKLVGYDVCFRAGPMYYKSIKEIKPDQATIENIKIMVNRILKFVEKYGPIKEEGMTFDGAYTEKISSGDADFMTEDTLWDLKTSKNGPQSSHTLQLLIYYLLGMHSDNEKYSKIKKLGIFNPKLNKVYIIEISKISENVIKEVEENIIGYNKENTDISETDEVYTITDLTKILGCSRYRIMKHYSESGLPLEKVKNKYVINKIDFAEWFERKIEKELNDGKITFFEFLILLAVAVVLLIILFTIIEYR